MVGAHRHSSMDDWSRMDVRPAAGGSPFGGSPMDNLSAQGVAVSKSPFGPWRRLGVVAPGGLAWAADRKGGVS